MLAAGRSSRFGSNKLLEDLGGDTLLERAIRACGSYRAVVVTSSELAPSVKRAGRAVIVNDDADRGMTHSLRLANARIHRDEALAVLPADLPGVSADRISLVIERAQDVDVCYPARSDGTPGHPVIFSAAARRHIGALPDGDSIRLLRDCAGLTRRIVAIDEDWPFKDVDIRSDLPTE